MEKENTGGELPEEFDKINLTEVMKEEPVWRLRDFKGFLHAHSWEGSSCGRDTVKRIKEAVAKKTGLEYIGFSEHVGWPGEEYWTSKIIKEFEVIDNINTEGTRPKFFKGIEVNVMPDGTIDAPKELLSNSDLIVGSIHYDNTDKPEEKNAESTVERWCKIMDNYPEVNMLGHPLRNLDESEWPKMNWDRLCQKAKEKNVIIEFAVSDHITRDMPVEFLLALRKHDNLISVSADIHSIRTYLTEEGDLTDSQANLLKEFSFIKNEISKIAFNDEEKIKNSEKNTPEENEKQAILLKQLKAKHNEIEDSKELAQIYDVLTANVKYREDKEGNISAEKRPFSYRMLRRFAKRINQLRKSISHENKTPIVPPQNIINLWSEAKIENWINSRKKEINIKKQLNG